MANYASGQRTPKLDSPNVPKILGIEPEKVVVAYAEATPLDFQKGMPWEQYNRMKKEAAKLPPLYWVAQRLRPRANREFFSELILPREPISEKSLAHLELEHLQLANAISIETFRERWDEFVEPDDLLVLPNQKTMRLLRHTGVEIGNYELLKSINFDPQKTCSGIAEFLASVQWEIDAPSIKGRAGRRLANSVALTRYLRSLLRFNSPFLG